MVLLYQSDVYSMKKVAKDIGFFPHYVKAIIVWSISLFFRETLD